MPKSLYAFNVTRQAFVSMDVTLADSPLARLRGLLGKIKLRSDEGVWIVPSRGVHTIGLMFPIDVVYLDSGLRVLHLVESLGPFRISPIRMKCASVLELPARSAFASGTQVGDQLMIGPPEAVQESWASQCTDLPGLRPR